MSNFTYTEIAKSFEKWGEYVDPDATMSEEDFDAMSVEDRIQFVVDCFGPDESEYEDELEYCTESRANDNDTTKYCGYWRVGSTSGQIYGNNKRAMSSDLSKIVRGNMSPGDAGTYTISRNDFRMEEVASRHFKRSRKA